MLMHDGQDTSDVDELLRGASYVGVDGVHVDTNRISSLPPGRMHDQ